MLLKNGRRDEKMVEKGGKGGRAKCSAVGSLVCHAFMIASHGHRL